MDMQTPAERHLMLDASDLLSARWPLPQKRSARNIIISMETITIFIAVRSPAGRGLLTQILDLIRSAIPPHSNTPPAEVFGVIETALRSHFAREIPA
jgi:hypothetical protein